VTALSAGGAPWVFEILAYPQPRVPHPFALLAKGWAARTSATFFRVVERFRQLIPSAERRPSGLDLGRPFSPRCIMPETRPRPQLGLVN
jgi:hypothetical protein